MKVHELFESGQKCKFCKSEATMKIIWAEGRGYVPCCDKHEEKAKSKVDCEKVVKIPQIRVDLYNRFIYTIKN